MPRKKIYIAATNQHVGKTTITLGLTSAFMKKKVNVGYCKPVGQQHQTYNDIIVDKDTVLFADLIRFDLKQEIHSPVILGKGATENYIDNPNDYNYEQDIRYAQNKLEQLHDMIIYEGTGHPGVGSVCDISNPKVAEILDASVIMVVEGGIGSTIDRLHMSMALFREKNIPLIGVIINKVIPSKLNKVKTYIKKWCDNHNIKLLGVIPYDNTLAYPVIWTVAQKIKGTIIYNGHKGSNKVSKTVPGSVIEKEDIDTAQDILMVVSPKSVGIALRKAIGILNEHNITTSPFSGIVITGIGELDDDVIEYIEKHEIPVIRTSLDTYGVYLKISRIEVKINRNTPWKVLRAIELIEEHVDLNYLLKNNS